jgi:hypothetical protein
MNDPPETKPAADPDQGSVCLKCGCSLAGLSPAGDCPECGAAYALGNVIADDRPCLQCGYNLRGLSPTGACPECGTPVQRSLLGNLLVYSSREYVRQLIVGVRLIWWSIAIVIVMSVGGVLLGIVLSAAMGGATSLGHLVALGGLVTTAMGLVGWWLLSSPDPAVLGEDKAVGARKVLRVSLVVSAGCFLANTVFQYGFGRVGGSVFAPMFGRGFGTGGAGAPTTGTAVDWLAAAAALVSQVAWLVKFFASMVYVRGLAARVPDEKVYARARVLMWFGASLGCVLILVMIVAMVAVITMTASASRGGAPAGVMLLMVPLMCGGGIAWIVFLVMYVGLIDRLKRALVQVGHAIEQEGDPTAV